MSAWEGRHATPPPYVDCRAQEAIDALTLARFNLAVRQNEQRRAQARVKREADRAKRFGIGYYAATAATERARATWGA